MILKWLQAYWFLLSIICMMSVAGGTRLFKLAQVPAALAWDEAAIGYNAYSIWTTRRDEWQKLMPISFQSFGDYKAPLAIYMVTPFIGLLGLEAIFVRLPFALVGIALPFALGLLGFELAKLYENNWKIVSPRVVFVLFAGLAALSPWHIFFSRAGFESGIAVFLITVSLWLFLRWLRLQNWFVLGGSALFAAVSLYAYHSAKVVVPLLGLFLICFYWEEITSFVKQQMWQFILILTGGLVVVSPLLYDSLLKSGADRLTQTSYITDSIPLLNKAGIFMQQFLAHFSADYLVSGATATLRHGDGSWGVLLPTTFILLLISIGFGMYQLQQAVELGNRWNIVPPTFILGLVLILAGTVPAALGVDGIPHANRALMSLPGYTILAVWGFDRLLFWVRQSKINHHIKGNHGELDVVYKACLGTIVLLHCSFALAALHTYYEEFPPKAVAAFQEGYLEAFELAEKYERGVQTATECFPEANSIIFTSNYGQPYIYALFQRQTNPIAYRGGSLVKYQFEEIGRDDFSRENALVVADRSADLGSRQPDHVITVADGTERFRFYYTGENEVCE